LLDEHPGTNGNDLFGMANDLDAARLLLARGAGVNRGNDYGWTKLHQAGHGNDRGLAELLLAAGARTDLQHAATAARRSSWRSSGDTARSSTSSGSNRATYASRPGSAAST
jgi:ankyrin repeat protein